MVNYRFGLLASIGTMSKDPPAPLSWFKSEPQTAEEYMEGAPDGAKQVAALKAMMTSNIAAQRAAGAKDKPE